MRIAFIGGGQMAASLIGALRSQGQDGGSITVADPVPARTEQLAREFAVHTTGDNAAAVRDADTIVLAVKPQDMRGVAAGISPVLAERRRLVISIAAGIRLSDLARWLGPTSPLVRAMPNRPAIIGRGITALYASPEVRSADRTRAERIFASCGETLWIESESQMDAVTAISGSGPAYFFLLMEALEEAGRAHGLPPGIARRLAVVTAAGAGQMAVGGSDDPASLREQVTSKGGTTAAALAVLDAADLRGIFTAAVAAAARRSAELAAQAGKQ
jgi:pyrroline-5-carboxylate reductase